VHAVVLDNPADLVGFRAAVRVAMAAGIAPDAIHWHVASR
jgi:hypothetical protein